MQYGELCPLWVISSLDDESAQLFAAKLERQMMAFAESEFGAGFDPARDRWWKIDNIHHLTDIEIDDSGHPAGVPVYQKKEGDNVDLSGLTIVLYGNNEEFTTCIDVVNYLRKKRDANEFMLGGGNQVRYYGLLSFNKGDAINENLKTLINEKPKATKQSRLILRDSFPFDTIFLQGNCNRVSQNRFCYDKLVGDDGKRNDIDLSVQVCYHLALTHDVLTYVNQQRLTVVGAFSLNYEPEKARHAHAIDLTNDIVAKFSNDDQGEHWYKENAADISDSFKKEYGWKSIYGGLINGFKSNDTNDIVPQSSVSPWKLFLRELIPYYFRKYIRGLVRHVRDNVDGFSFVTLQSYQNHIDNRFEGMSRDEELRKHIEDELSNLWDKESPDSNTIGMKQFLSRLKRMKDFFVKQKDTVDGLLNGRTADGTHSGFPELEDYPLSKFGEYQEAYSGYVRKDPDGTNSIRGEEFLQKTIRTLSFHPVPLSLFIRSLLLGILLPLIMLTTLKLIPDGLLQTTFLEKAPGSYILCGGCFLLCLGWALLKYGLGVVGKVKSTLKDYVGWSLYRLQMSAYRKTLEKEKAYYENGISICDDIEGRSSSFATEVIQLKKDDNEGFEENMFQANVLGSFEGYRVLKVGVVVPKVTTTVNKYGEQQRTLERVFPNRDEKRDDLHFGVLRQSMIVLDDNGVKKCLKRILFGHKSDDDFERVTIDVKAEKEEFCKVLSEAIAKEIVFHINDRQIQTVSDIVLGKDGICNFESYKVGKDDITMGEIINARSHPSAEVLDPFSFASMVVPDRSQEWRNVLQVEDDGSGRYDTVKGVNEISILQGLSASHLSCINDIKMS